MYLLLVRKDDLSLISTALFTHLSVSVSLSPLLPILFWVILWSSLRVCEEGEHEEADMFIVMISQ